jgi:hypothetical protein
VHLLAHADLSTTMLYTEVLGDELADTAQLLEGPGPAAHTSKLYGQPPEATP